MGAGVVCLAMACLTQSSGLPSSASVSFPLAFAFSLDGTAEYIPSCIVILIIITTIDG
jgi:hypothetical protein